MATTPRRGSDLGDGDRCPLDPEHGKMYVVARNRQWCPHSDHARKKLTRCYWPLYDLKEAVAAYTVNKPAPVLDDIDISALES